MASNKSSSSLSPAMRVVEMLKARGIVTAAQSRPSEYGSAAIFRTHVATVGGSVHVFDKLEAWRFDALVAAPAAGDKLAAAPAARALIIWQGEDEAIDRAIVAVNDEVQRLALQ